MLWQKSLHFSYYIFTCPHIFYLLSPISIVGISYSAAIFNFKFFFFIYMFFFIYSSPTGIPWITCQGCHDFARRIMLPDIGLWKLLVWILPFITSAVKIRSKKRMKALWNGNVNLRPNNDDVIYVAAIALQPIHKWITFRKYLYFFPPCNKQVGNRQGKFSPHQCPC